MTNDDSIVKHFNLLQQEFQKLSLKYQKLKQNYEELAAVSVHSSSNSEHSFASNLLRSIRNVYRDKRFSDLVIKLEKSGILAHKIVFEAHNGDWGITDLDSVSEISFEDIDQNIGEQVVKWIYTQELNEKQSSEFLWKIARVGHEKNLQNLKSRCETALLSKVDKDNCIMFYNNACEIQIDSLKSFCIEIIFANWKEYKYSDFHYLSASVFLELLELQSNYPLHLAIKANRDDVVFLFLNENFSQLEEVVNTVNEDNELVMDLALENRRIELSNTLLKYCVNLNAVDLNELSLLHRAVLRRDEFSAKFLIQNGCQINPLSPDTSQTPLQIIAKMKSSEESKNAFDDMISLAKVLIENGADVNHVDSYGKTALSLSVLSGNESVMYLILESGRCTSINGFPNNVVYKPLTNDSPRASAVLSFAHVLPLWLAISRVYQPDLLKEYDEFSANSKMNSNPIVSLIEHEADPFCMFDPNSGNSIFLECISRNLEDAAIFILDLILKRYDKKCVSTSTDNFIAMTNSKKETALHLAVSNDLSRLCKILLQCGADPNSVRRKSVISVMTAKDDWCSSSDSINSCPVSKNTNDFNLNKKLDESLNNASSTYLSVRGDSRNPFKDYMAPNDDEKCYGCSSSLPNVQKQNPAQTLLYDVILNKNQMKGKKLKKRSKRMQNNTERQHVVDLMTPVHLAIRKKNFEIINMFIELDGIYGPKIDWLLSDNSGESAFTMALWNGLLSVADKIFNKISKSGIKVKVFDDIVEEETPLFHLAIRRSMTDVVQFLIKIGCDINIRSSNGSTPLHLATEMENIDIIKALCLAKADLDAIYLTEFIDTNYKVTNNPMCPLLISLFRERFDISKILTEDGCDLDMWLKNPKDNFEESLLHICILQKKEEAAIFLISNCCDINSPREPPTNSKFYQFQSNEFNYICDNTPLHQACQLGLSRVVSSLLKSTNVNFNAQNVNGSTPLHLAIENQEETIVSLLLNSNLKLNLSLKDNQGHTPFHTAMSMSNQKAAKKILEFEPNAANETDNCGRNFLHIAVESMNKEALFFLIQVNANLNVRVQDTHMYTPLQLSVMSGAPEDMIRSLILAGAKIEDETIEKQNLLHLAVIHNRANLLACLIESGVSTSHPDNNFDTPLHKAIKSGVKELVEPLLIKSSNHITIKNLRGENILHTLAINAKDNMVVLFSLLMDIYPTFPLNEKDASGNTALYLSVLGGHTKLGIALVKKGASLGCVNNDGTTLFNSDEISESILVKLMDAIEMEPSWCEGEACVSCFCKFSIKNRKHHCRHCGRLICGRCSTNEIPIIKFGVKKPVRICDQCFNFLVNGRVK